MMGTKVIRSEVIYSLRDLERAVEFIPFDERVPLREPMDLEIFKVNGQIRLALTKTPTPHLVGPKGDDLTEDA